MSNFPENEATSWGELIKDYEKRKKGQVESEGDNAKACRVEKHDMNPITQKYADDEIEEQMQKTEGSFKILNEAMARNLERQHVYNVVNNQSNVPGNPVPIPMREPKQQSSRRDYNIVSNVHLSKHHYLPPSERIPMEKEKTLEDKGRTHTNQDRTISNRPRDFDIVSNRYFEFNEEKAAFDKNRSKILANLKQEVSRPNPILKGDSEIKKMPKRIVEKTQATSFLSQLRGKDTSPRKLKGGRTRHQCEQHLNQQAMEKTDRHNRRAMNRCTISKENILSHYAHGYDIISNQQQSRAEDQ